MKIAGYYESCLKTSVFKQIPAKNYTLTGRTK
jgi:hypothetical protein